MWQSPPYAIAPERGSVSITCSTPEPLRGVYLKRSRWPEPDNVIYYEDGKEPTVDERFRGRVTFSGSQHNLTVSMHHLRPADTGTYVCQVIVQDEGWGPGTLVVVTGRGSTHPEPTPPACRPGRAPLLHTCRSRSFQLRPASSRESPGLPLASGPLPALNPEGARGLPDSPSVTLCSFFPDTRQEAQPTHPALLVALAVSFFHVGLGLGALCVLMRTKVSATPWPSPLREQGGKASG